MTRNKALAQLLFLLIFQNIAEAQIQVSDMENRSGVLVNKYAQMYSTSEQLPISEVLKRMQPIDLLALPNPTALGFSNDTHWVLIEIEADKMRDLILEVDNPHIDRISLFQISDTLINLGTTGDNFLVSSRPIRHTDFAFPIQIQPGINKYLLQIYKFNSSIHLPILLWGEDAFYEDKEDKMWFHGWLLSVIFTLGLSCLVLGLLVKNASLIFYGIYATLASLYIFSDYGYFSLLITSNIPSINDYVRPVISALSSCFIILFVRKLINIKKHVPLLDRFILGILSLFVILILLLFLNEQWLRSNGILILKIYYGLILLEFLGVSLAAILCFRHEKINVSIFFLSTFFGGLGSITFMFHNFGWYDPTRIPFSPLIAGFSVEVILLGLTLATKAYFEHRAIELKAEVIEPPTNANTYLGSTHYKANGHFIETYSLAGIITDSSRKSLSTLEESLPAGQFIRTHRSYLVNTAQIKALYADRLILQNGTELPISRSYRKHVKQKLK